MRPWAATRLIGMIQPGFDGALREDGEPEIVNVGCMGRITSLTETGDGRYMISLQGVCRFRVAEELSVKTPFRQCRVSPFVADLDEDRSGAEVDGRHCSRRSAPISRPTISTPTGTASAAPKTPCWSMRFR